MGAIGQYFEIILLILTLSSFVIMLASKYIINKSKDKNEGWLAEYAKSLFPVFLVVFLIRSFLFEPYKIPSGSMLPTLKIGDFIFVSKFSYGIRYPVWWNHTMINTGHPKKGDIVVFRYPVNPNINFIKRVVGVPGDHISYINKQLWVNGQIITKTNLGPVYDSDLKDDISNPATNKPILYKTTNGDIAHYVYNFPWRESVSFKDLVVPKGNYFVMGDDRDDSEDSRYWGFVPEQNMVGKAVMIWFSWGNDGFKFSRIGRMLGGSQLKYPQPGASTSTSASSSAKHKNNVKKMDDSKLDDSSKNTSHEKANNKQSHDKYKIEKVSKAASKIN